MALNKQSEYIPFRVKWDEVPGRDEAYKIKTIAALGGGAKGLRKWRQEYECFFAGSGGSLIEGDILEKLIFKTILESRLDDHFLIYEYPEEDSKYITISDVGEGVGADSSTTQVLKVVDLQKKKFKQVACYRDNTIKTNEFDLIVHNLSAYYNNALAICENNSYGREILNRLVYDNDYDNVFFEGEGKDYGMKMTTQSKKMGCSYLKKYIEDATIELVDFETISELSKYIKKGNSYEADKGAHDDLVTPLVLFSYFLSKKENIENWLDFDIGKNQMQQRIVDELLPMGFVCNGHTDVNLNEAIQDDEDDFDNEEEIFIRSVEIRS